MKRVNMSLHFQLSYERSCCKNRGEQGLSLSSRDRTRSSELQLQDGRLWVGTGKIFLPLTVVKLWHRYPGEVGGRLDSPSLEVFKGILDEPLPSMI